MPRPYARIVLSLTVCSALALAWTAAARADGNRYDLERRYHSEISAAKAYLLISEDADESHRGGKKQGKGRKGDDRSVIMIDVRDVTEYAAGHPKNALSIPYPHIYGRPGDANYIPQDPVVFVNAVVAAIPDQDTAILTLCRTGFRSVLAANLLADAGYGKVRNVWQGFVGNYKTDINQNVLDLNNDGALNDADRDGWMNFQELPYSTELKPRLLYQPYLSLYYQ